MESPFGFTVYTEADDINIMAGDTFSVPFLVVDENGQAVDLTDATVEARFCYYDHPDFPIAMTPVEDVLKKDEGITNKLWLNLFSDNTSSLGDAQLEYQIIVTVSGVTYNRMCGTINIKTMIE